MDASGLEKGPLSRMGHWVETAGARYLLAVAPYLFGFACLWGGVRFPELVSRSRTLPVEEAVPIWTSEWTVWLVLVALTIAFWAGRRTVRMDKAMGKRLSALELENQKVRKERDEMRTGRAEAEEQVEELRSRLDQALKEVISLYLRRCMRHRVFAQTERVSLYAYTDEHFVLAGRHSEHPDNKNPRRQRFPSRQGCIGSAWYGDPCFVTLPDPDTETQAYLDVMNLSFGLNANAVSALRMKSRVYYARAIQSHDTTRVGVIVFESTRVDGLDQPYLESIVSRKQPYLADLITRSAMVSPFINMQQLEAA